MLSFALPLPVITLIMFTSRRDLMGSLVNTKLTTVLASLSGAIILLLNIVLLYLVFAPLLGWWQPS